MIAGLRGSGGKTLVSVGLTAAWRNLGFAVAPYKKGADYIDAAWLAAAAGHPCRNLDLFMIERDVVFDSFVRTARGSDLAVIEGNRGLFDGMDAGGTYSAAELAKLLKAPVILVCDCSKTTRTLGAMVLGCQRFDPAVHIKGVVLNQVAGRRHESVLRDVIQTYCGLPVLGAIPRLAECPFPERHLGLVPPQEHGEVPGAVQAAARVVEEHIDLDALMNIARTAPPLVSEPEASAGGTRGDLAEKELPAHEVPSAETGKVGKPGGKDTIKPEPDSHQVRIGVFRDEAFQFYYPENLEALEREGGRLIESSPLRDRKLPEADAIYIGGGFPETFAEELAANVDFRHAVAAAVEAGMPVYAECAGAVYLGRSLIMGENTYPMAGALPVVFGFDTRPQGHGYAIMEVTRSNPYFPVGDSFRGHEFHYSRVLDLDEKKLSFAFRVQRGYGIDGEHDGICRKNTLATYCHIHALGVGNWARSLVQAGMLRRRSGPA